MEKTITIEDKSIRFKSSAATNILYKRTFGEDILIKLTSYTKNLKELREMEKRMKELQNETDKTDTERAEEMNKMLQSDCFVETNKFSSETLPKLAYIMWLEANETQETIFKKLTEENYLMWLMNMNTDELLTVTSEVMDLWQAGAKNHSKPKN